MTRLELRFRPLAKNEGLKCVYCEKISLFMDPFATPYSNGNRRCTPIWFILVIVNVITHSRKSQTKHGVLNHSLVQQAKGIDTFTEPFEEIGVPKWLIGIGGVIAAVTGINYLSKKL